MKSLFKAKIYHKRFLPRVNEFTYSGFYIKFSLNKLPQMNSKFFSVNRFNLFSFYEKDHGYRDGSSISNWAKDILAQAGIKDFQGDFVLQTFPRVLGYVFNPVSFWFCYQESQLVAIIAEVNNTFGESHNYVLTQGPGKRVAELNKEFHVSPFYKVQGQYYFDLRTENQISINYHFDGMLQLMTHLSGKEVVWSDKEWLKLFFQYPFYTLLVMVLIHYQALKLFIKKNKFYSRPEKSKKELTYEYPK